MKFGKIRVEDGNFIFIKRMMINNLPCKDIVWAYVQRDNEVPVSSRIVMHFLVIITKRGKRYQFEMSEKEAQECIRLLKAMNSNLVSGFPKGGRLPMQTLSNTRDLGGLMSTDKRYLLPHRLLRSGDLYHLSQADQRVLREEYHLKKVIDLRTETERKRRPDTMIAGVEYYHIPLIDEEMTEKIELNQLGLLHLEHSEPEEEFMLHYYESFITDNYSVEQLARFLDILLKDCNGSILWHGGVGKDRTGIVTALVLNILRIPRKSIREDFNRTNGFLEEEWSYYNRLSSNYPNILDISQNELSLSLHAHETWLNYFFSTIDVKYTSMQQFLRRKMYLSPKDLDFFREKYLL